MALEMIDELIQWGRTPPVLTADAGYGDTTAFRQGLTDREIGYVVAVKGATSAYTSDAAPQTAPYAGRGSPPDPALPRPAPVLQGPGRGRRPRRPENGDLAPRHQDRPRQPGRGDALPIPRPAYPPGKPRHHPSRRRQPPRSLAARRMAHGAEEPTDYWISTLDPDTPLKELVRLAKIRWRIEHDYRELKTALGLDHFEGRSWTGWHHHATLVTSRPPIPHHPAANRPKSHGAGLTLYGLVRKLQRALAHWIGTCPLCHHTFPT